MGAEAERASGAWAGSPGNRDGIPFDQRLVLQVGGCGFLMEPSALRPVSVTWEPHVLEGDGAHLVMGAGPALGPGHPSGCPFLGDEAALPLHPHLRAAGESNEGSSLLGGSTFHASDRGFEGAWGPLFSLSRWRQAV